MNLKIGAVIRELRTKHGITQEKLAGHLGISVQAVSRWESETCYPDLEFVPKIANYFRVSADYLLGINQYDTAETATDYEHQWTAAVKNADHRLALGIITEALTVMPKNHGLMMKKIMSLLIAAGIAEEENRPEDMEKAIRECETLVNIILTESTSERLRCEAQMYLITIRSLGGEWKSVKKLSDDLPDIRQTKNCQLADFYVPSNEEHELCLRTFLHELFFHFFVTSKNLLSLPQLSSEERAMTAKKLVEILDLVTDGSYGEFELYLDTVYGILYEQTGNEQYRFAPDYYKRRYEKLPETLVYEKGFFKGCIFEHSQTIRSVDGSAK
ncbi:MAG: helix-turn-helix transcriptional regulator [Clostridia bacterium]|nr:helix-turn-helix transcriptional regulator [Clostridia bacterium]MBO5256435.1 helix-turn-helix transcriptional regulator [Clostridia bacterium]